MNGLPHGLAGRLLAGSITLLLLLTLGLGMIMPGLDWYRDRVELRDQREAMVRRMAGLAAGLPAMRAAYAERGRAAPPALLDGATDAIAAATLLARLQTMAREAELSVGSIETLPAEPLAGPNGAAALRRVGVRLSVDGRWEALIALLAACASASPRMTVDELRLAVIAPPGGEPARFEASFNVIALRTGTP